MGVSRSRNVIDAPDSSMVHANSFFLVTVRVWSEVASAYLNCKDSLSLVLVLVLVILVGYRELG